MKYLVPLVVSLTLGGCGGCKGEPGGGPDADDDVAVDAAVPGDPTTGAWRDVFGLPGPSGFGSRVEDVELGPDGKTYAAGIFSDAAGVPALDVAVWDGTDWAPLGDGLAGWVRAIAFDADGDLWAAVTSEQADAGSVQRWDGTAWTVEGTAAGGGVHDLAIVDGGIAVVGAFTAIDGVTTGSVAFHDGTGWHALGDGTINGEATAIAAQPGGFCVAGSFDTIGGVAAENAACWSGTAWSALGAGLPGGIAVLARSPTGTWYAGGTLTFVVDPDTGAYEAGIAILNGSTWEPFEGGIDNGFINEVRAIAFDGDDVLVGGCFASAGDSDVPASFIARWSPTTGWSQLAGGLRNDVGVFLPSIVGGNDIEVAGDGSLWIGGLFTRTATTPSVNLVHVSTAGVPAALVGTHPVLGVGGFIDDLALDGAGHVVAGGSFAFAGTTPTDSLASFDGTGWTDLGDGLAGIVRDVVVRQDGSIAVAGELVYEDAPIAFAQSTGSGWSLPGGAVDGVGFALVEDADGVLWLGGQLGAGDNLLRLDGSTWTPDGTFDDRVSALAILDGDLVAAGSFTGRISIRSDGAWAVPGGGLDGDFAYATTLAVSPALGLVVGGEFDGAGGNGAKDLARWDGSAWHDVGGGVDGFGGFGFVSALLAYGDGLFVSGGIDTAGGTVTVSNLAWYDGTAWHDLGGGLADLAESMVVSDQVLYVGGPFTVAGGRPASGLAAWDFSD
jgi:hypothetical protein